MHSFSFVIVLDGVPVEGNIANVKLEGNDAGIKISSFDGNIVAAIGDTSAKVPCAIAKGRVMIALSYTYASGILDLSVYNGNQSLGESRLDNLEIVPVEFVVGPADLNLYEALLYRSALSASDVESLANGELQKSSLEIYSVFEPESCKSQTVENHAMSLNGFNVDRATDTSVTEIDNTLVPAVYYGVNGIATDTPEKGRIYIVTANGKADKVRLK